MFGLLYVAHLHTHTHTHTITMSVTPSPAPRSLSLPMYSVELVVFCDWFVLLHSPGNRLMLLAFHRSSKMEENWSDLNVGVFVCSDIPRTVYKVGSLHWFGIGCSVHSLPFLSLSLSLYHRFDFVLFWRGVCLVLERQSSVFCTKTRSHFWMVAFCIA